MIKNKQISSIDIRYIPLFIVFLGVFRPTIIPSKIDVAFRVFCLFLGVAYIISQLSVKGLLNLSLIIVIPMLFSNYINYRKGQLPFSNLIYGIQYALCIYVLYSIILVYIKNNQSIILIKGLCSISGFYCVMSVLMIVFLGRSREYFIGSKFMTGYIILFYIAIKFYLNETIIQQNKRGRNIFIFQIILFEIVVYYIQCMTAFVMIFLFAIMAHAPKKLRVIFSQPVTMILLLFLSMITAFLLTSIINSPLISDIIVNVLHKDLTLTDRLRYYERALSVLQQGNIWYGFGYSSLEMREAIGLGTNIQNGLFQILLNYGLFGTSGLVIINYISAKKNKTSREDLWTLYVLIISFYFAAIVEISFNLVFFMSLFLLRWMGNPEIQKLKKVGLQQ